MVIMLLMREGYPLELRDFRFLYHQQKENHHIPIIGKEFPGDVFQLLLYLSNLVWA